MADLNPSYLIRQVTIDNVSWTNIVPPEACSGVRADLGTQDSDFLIRTDPNDAATEKRIASGWAWAPPDSPEGIFRIFAKGRAIVAVQSVAVGTFTLYVEFSS